MRKDNTSGQYQQQIIALTVLRRVGKANGLKTAHLRCLLGCSDMVSLGLRANGSSIARYCGMDTRTGRETAGQLVELGLLTKSKAEGNRKGRVQHRLSQAAEGIVSEYTRELNGACRAYLRK